MKGPEAKREAKFKQAVKKAGGISFKFASPGYSGVTDQLVVIPGGKVVFTEIKTPQGKMSALQLQFEKLIKYYGAAHEIIWCDEDIDKFIDKYFWHLL